MLRRAPSEATLHRLWVAAAYGFLLVALFTFQDFVWTTGHPPVSYFDHLVLGLSFGWLVAFPAAVLGLAGLIFFRPPRTTTNPEPIENLVSFRVVSRGDNREALAKTVENIRSQMAAQPLFPYRIEVVTDLPVNLPPAPDLVSLLVPASYQTPSGAKYKARALQYALDVSDLPEDAWIFHLDEESHVTPSLLAGICRAVREEEASGELRIGQGAILYHRDLDSQPFLTLADSIRTGDDLGRFHLQHRLGVTIFGLHGSFILVRNDVERAVGFDFGPAGSVTEDAYWALLQMDRGQRCRWVDGYVVEQSTRSVRDFLKQRRRWLVGLALTALRAPVSARYRAVLGVSTLLWAVSWLGIIAFTFNLVAGIRIPEPIRWAGNIAFAYYLLLYLLGMRVLARHHPDVDGVRRLSGYAAQLVLVPVFALMEAGGVLYAILRPDVAGFHVVKK